LIVSNQRIPIIGIHAVLGIIMITSVSSPFHRIGSLQNSHDESVLKKIKAVALV